MKLKATIQKNNPFTGQLLLTCPGAKLIAEQIEKLDPGKEYMITIEPQKSAKSQAQNKFFHELCKILAEYYGEPKYKAKYLFKLNFGVSDVYRIQGKDIIDLKSVAEYTQKEMSDLIDGSVKYMIQSGLSDDIERYQREYRSVID